MHMTEFCRRKGSGEFTQPGDKNLMYIAGDHLPSGEGEGRGAGAALRLGEGAAAPVRRLLQKVGELPLLLGQHAVGRPRGRSVSL